MGGSDPNKRRALPVGWERLVDKASGKTYYVDTATKHSQWDFPERGAKWALFPKDAPAPASHAPTVTRARKPDAAPAAAAATAASESSTSAEAMSKQAILQAAGLIPKRRKRRPGATLRAQAEAAAEAEELQKKIDDAEALKLKEALKAFNLAAAAEAELQKKKQKELEEAEALKLKETLKAFNLAAPPPPPAAVAPPAAPAVAAASPVAAAAPAPAPPPPPMQLAAAGARPAVPQVHAQAGSPVARPLQGAPGMGMPQAPGAVPALARNTMPAPGALQQVFRAPGAPPMQGAPQPGYRIPGAPVQGAPRPGFPGAPMQGAPPGFRGPGAPVQGAPHPGFRGPGAPMQGAPRPGFPGAPMQGAPRPGFPGAPMQGAPQPFRGGPMQGAPQPQFAGARPRMTSVLRPMPQGHTGEFQLCRLFQTTGNCPTQQCPFAHGTAELSYWKSCRPKGPAGGGYTGGGLNAATGVYMQPKPPGPPVYANARAPPGGLLPGVVPPPPPLGQKPYAAEWAVYHQQQAAAKLATHRPMAAPQRRAPQAAAAAHPYAQQWAAYYAQQARYAAMSPQEQEEAVMQARMEAQAAALKQIAAEHAEEDDPSASSSYQPRAFPGYKREATSFKRDEPEEDEKKSDRGGDAWERSNKLRNSSLNASRLRGLAAKGVDVSALQEQADQEANRLEGTRRRNPSVNDPTSFGKYLRKQDPEFYGGQYADSDEEDDAEDEAWAKTVVGGAQSLAAKKAKWEAGEMDNQAGRRRDYDYTRAKEFASRGVAGAQVGTFSLADARHARAAEAARRARPN